MIAAIRFLIRKIADVFIVSTDKPIVEEVEGTDNGFRVVCRIVAPAGEARHAFVHYKGGVDPDKVFYVTDLKVSDKTIGHGEREIFFNKGGLLTREDRAAVAEKWEVPVPLDTEDKSAYPQTLKPSEYKL